MPVDVLSPGVSSDVQQEKTFSLRSDEDFSRRVYSSAVRAADCRSAGPWFKSRCALCVLCLLLSLTGWRCPCHCCCCHTSRDHCCCLCHMGLFVVLQRVAHIYFDCTGGTLADSLLAPDEVPDASVGASRGLAQR